MNRPDLIAIGASMGAIEACNVLLPAITADAKFAVAVVIHVSGDTPVSLAKIFEPRVKAPVGEAADKEPIQPGRIYSLRGIASSGRVIGVHPGSQGFRISF